MKIKICIYSKTRAGIIPELELELTAIPIPELELQAMKLESELQNGNDRHWNGF